MSQRNQLLSPQHLHSRSLSAESPLMGASPDLCVRGTDQGHGAGPRTRGSHGTESRWRFGWSPLPCTHPQSAKGPGCWLEASAPYGGPGQASGAQAGPTLHRLNMLEGELPKQARGQKTGL